MKKLKQAGEIRETQLDFKQELPLSWNIVYNPWPWHHQKDRGHVVIQSNILPSVGIPSVIAWTDGHLTSVLAPQWLNFHCFIRPPVPLLKKLNNAGFQTLYMLACLCNMYVYCLCSAETIKWWQISLAPIPFPPNILIESFMKEIARELNVEGCWGISG